MHMMSRFLIFTIVSFAAAMERSQDGGWPRVVKDGGTQIVVYQPQPSPAAPFRSIFSMLASTAGSKSNSP